MGSGSRSRVFYDQKLQNISSWKKLIIICNEKFQFTYSQASIQDVQAPAEAFSPRKREHPAIQNKKFLS
jgi:hypothetical protein